MLLMHVSAAASEILLVFNNLHICVFRGYFFFILISLLFFVSLAVGAPPKSVYKPKFPSATPLKGRPSVSPLPSPPEHSVPPASPFGTGNLSKGHTSVEDVMSIHFTSKENATSSVKEMPNRAISGALLEKPARKGNLGAKPMDMQSMLISLLLEKPEGMSLKVSTE